MCRFLSLLILTCIAPVTHAVDAPAPVAEPTPSPASDPANPPPTPEPVPSWRDRYTAGPGDIFDFSLYGQPDLDRGKVFVRPDGCIGYLQATDVMATGHHNPRVIITPVELRSKHYVILGKVVDKGVFALEQPITIIEAVARARGVETGLFEGNTVELADLPRSFIVRNKSRLPVDFEKLFFEGDLTQNIQIEPGDFIYFASAISNDVFVLGEVGQPGVLGFTPHLTVLGCITVRGGFSQAAYRGRVLIVRGSLQKPEVIVVNVNEVLAGKALDVALMPKDIIYVSRRPWMLAEELTNMAINTFLSSMTSSWTDRNLRPALPSGVLPQLR